ncbi:glycosyltransferase [Billgrantia sulfidoxydans]|uniref:Glycosyltransferase n=1 Tax=Billgrantia sulfidoxydans TaxID=2733484 RepID=A0ABX7W4F1_9GAMM|nr:glycosyltransferase [Halomonas sulfidoxydans]QTP55239.1 glycosyltransferase [Halomonas sulfidoxydans]
MQKRFAFVISDLYGGGAQKSLLYTAEGLRQRGHAVKVFTLRERIEHRIPEGLEIVNLAVINRFTKAFNTSWVEKWQARNIAKAVSDFRADTVLSCSCDRITRHMQHPNLYFWVKGDSSAQLRHSPKREKEFAKQRRYYSGRKIIAVSHGVEKNLQEVIGIRPSHIQTIYNPYERHPFLEMAKEEVSVPFAEYFIHVGAFTHVKRQDRLLRAYARSGIETPLMLLGKGETEGVIKQLIAELGLEDRVAMLGYRTNPYPFIQRAKALVLTSDAEGLPRVLIEALLLHTPVISVDCPSGPREILTGELTDFLVGQEDEAGLADAMARMDAAPVKIDERYYQQFLTENVIPQFEAL